MKNYRDPDFQNAIIKSINESKLVLFIGAGFSKLCGLPLWIELAHELINECVKANIINFSDKSLIVKDKDARTLITIAYHLLEEYKKLDSFSRIFQKFLTIDKENETLDIKNQRDQLIDLVKRSHATVLTTNSDDILHECFAEGGFIHYSIDDITSFILTEERHLVHLHGYVKDKSSLVYTTDQYLRRYANNEFKDMIQKIFRSDITILFIGYGLNDMQFLDFLVNTDMDTSNKYVIEGFFDYEKANYNAKRIYYKTLKLDLVTYSKDKAEYTGLLDALDFLVNEAEKNSKVKSDTYNKALSLINSKPTSERVLSLQNHLIVMDNLEQVHLLNNLPDSTYAPEWLIVMFRYNICSHVFSVKEGLKVVTNNNGKVVANYSGINVVSKVYKNAKHNNKIFEISKSILLDVFEMFEQNDDLYKFTSVVDVVERWLFSDYRLMNLSQSYEFIKNDKSRTDDSHSWITWLYYQTKELLNCNIKTTLKFASLIVKCLSDNEIQRYEFSSFLKVYKIGLTEKYPYPIFKLLIEAIHIKAKTGNLFFLEMHGSFANLRNSEGNELSNDNLVSWLLTTLEYLSPIKIKTYYEKWSKSHNKFDKNLAIYLVNVNYTLLKSDFFALEVNPFNDWDKFSELYHLVMNHVSDFSEEEVEKLTEWIGGMRTNHVSDFYNRANKYELFCLLSNTEKNHSAFQIANSIYTSFTNEEKESLKQLPNAASRNKMFWTHSYSIEDDEEFSKNLLNTDADNFVKLISRDLNDSQKHSINTVFVECLKKYSIFRWITDNNCVNFTYFPKSYLDNLLEAMLEEKPTYPFTSIITFIDKAFSVLSVEELESFVSRFLHSMYYHYLREIRGDTKENKSVSAFILDLERKVTVKWDDNSYYKQKLSYRTLLSIDAFYMVSTSIITAFEIKDSSILDRLDSLLVDDKKASVTKATISANIYYIWNINSEWVKKNIDAIFNNVIDKHNLSIIGFNISCFYYEGFIRLLYERNLLGDILNSYDFSENLPSYINNILFSIAGLEDMDNIVKVALSSREGLRGLQIFSEKIKDVIDFENYECKINCIFDLALQVDFSEKVESGQAIKRLLNVYTKFSDKTHCWKLIIHLLKNPGIYFIKEITETIRTLTLSNDMIIEFVTKYVENLHDHYYYMEEIVEIVNQPNWIGHENEKQQLINLLGKISPDFYIKFQNKISV